MLKLFIIGKQYRTNAKAEYDESTKNTIVLKGSVVSEKIASFTQNKKIEEMRKKCTNKDGVLTRNITFSNPTAAAQFVCGYSVSGPVAWHVEKHKKLSQWIKENKER